MKNLFNSVKVTAPRSNTFDLTHDVKMSGRMGYLMPVCVTEVVPGDQMQISGETLIRFAPMVAPVMHRMNATIHYFFVPNRILWTNWEDFITGTAGIAAPYINIDGTETAEQQRFLDYMGVPPFDAAGGVTEQINALPLCAYQRIYDEYYRDQNLVTAQVSSVLSGDNTVRKSALTALRKRAWEHDYFTACLPFAQKGAAVDLPLGDVVLKDLPVAQQLLVDPATGLPLAGAMSAGGVGGEVQVGGVDASIDPNGSWEVGATTINDLRRAFRLQEWLEKMARGGSRYIEQILVHFGVRSSDKRLDRPEYITGIKTPVVVSEVLNTTGETAGLPQGNMAGHGVAVGTGNYGRYFAEEHGWIIGIMSVMPIPAYMQGVHKSFLKREALDYYWPSFAHIGEQEVQNRELMAYHPGGDDTFGYIPRYSEYKFLPSRVAGEFRTTLDYWHLAREFAAPPALNQDFIEVDPADVERIFAVSGQDNLYIHVLNRIKARRRMPVFGTPQL